VVSDKLFKLNTIKILSLSDTILETIYSPQVKTRFADVDLILGCGDLAYYYLEYIVSNLQVPLYYVRGNHANLIEHTSSGPKAGPQGGTDLHLRVVNHHGIILAGIEGSLRYKRGPFMYSQSEMWMNVMLLVPRLLKNKAVFGRYLDIFISHAPPWGINDKQDLPHQGIKAFRWLLEKFRPRYHFHGHIHVYRQYEETVTKFKSTKVINTYGYAETEIN
jgi:Icc-related predicted phosphoesterase